MKHLLSLCFLFFTFFSVLHAQPVINSSITPKIGDSWTGFFIELDTMDYAPGEMGANVSWDFSGIADSIEVAPEIFIEELTADPFLTFSVVSPEGVLFADSFPNTDFAIRTFLDFFITSEFYSFVDAQPDGLYELGEVDVVEFDFIVTGIDTTLTVNPSPLIYIPFPLTYQDHFIRNDTSTVSDADFGTITDTYTRDSIVVDAYGTLTTPFASYDNVLRWVKYTTTTEVTSLLTGGNPFQTSTTTSLSYEWYAPTQAAPIISYNLPNTDEGEENATMSFYVQTAGVTSAREQQHLTLPLTIAPNPARDQVNIQFTLEDPVREMSLSIFDLNGRLVNHTSWGALPAGPQNQAVAIPAALANGQYLVRLRGDGFVGRRFLSVAR